MSPAEWVAMVTDDSPILNKDDYSGKGSHFLLCAGTAVTGGGQGEVTSSTGHIPEVTTGSDRLYSQDWSRYWLCKYTAQIHTHSGDEVSMKNICAIHPQCLPRLFIANTAI